MLLLHGDDDPHADADAAASAGVAAAAAVCAGGSGFGGFCFWLLRLRWSEPELRRPYRIPLNRRSLCILFAPQLVMCVGIIAFSMRTLPGVLLWAAVIVSGLLLPRFGRQCFGAPARESRSAYSYHAAWSGASRFSAED